MGEGSLGLSYLGAFLLARTATIFLDTTRWNSITNRVGRIHTSNQQLTDPSPFLTDSCVRHYGPRVFERLKILISREQCGQVAEHLSNACS